MLIVDSEVFEWFVIMSFNLREYCQVTEDHSKLLQEDLKKANRQIGMVSFCYFVSTLLWCFVLAQLRAENRGLRRQVFEANSELDGYRRDPRFFALTLERRQEQFGGSVQARLEAGKHLTALTKGKKLAHKILLSGLDNWNDFLLQRESKELNKKKILRSTLEDWNAPVALKLHKVTSTWETF